MGCRGWDEVGSGVQVLTCYEGGGVRELGGGCVPSVYVTMVTMSDHES